jgi:KDO2-lipid IV(A) lauroyltransferase
MPRHRIRARDHLRIAFGAALPEKQVDRLVLGSMQQMAMMAMELLFTPRLINPWTWPRYVWPGDLRAALDVLLDRRGAILLTGHYGNWELTGYLLATWGFDVVAVMRPLDNPYLNRYIMAMREKRGLRLLFKKGAIQSADEVLEGGGILAFIADQNAGRKGLFVDFFGRPASTYKSIGLLAMRHRVPIVVGGARRRSLRFEYDIIAPRVILPEEWEQQADPLRYITQEYTRAFEAIVREAPEQYLWIHRRWKSQPR